MYERKDNGLAYPREYFQKEIIRNIRLLKEGDAMGMELTSVYDDFESIGFHDFQHVELMQIVFDTLLEKLRDLMQKYDDAVILAKHVGMELEEQVPYVIEQCYRYKEDNAEREESVVRCARVWSAWLYLHCKEIDNASSIYQDLGHERMLAVVEAMKKKCIGGVFNPRSKADFHRILDGEIAALKNILEEFPKPFLTEEEKNRILDELKKKVEAF